MSLSITRHLDTGAEPNTILQVLTPEGTRHPDPVLDPHLGDVDDEKLRGLYRDMVVLRRIDREGVALQRQGQLGLWAPCEGQEATQIGTGRALAAKDYVFPSYRETGLVYVRGAQPGDYVRMWRGEEGAAFDPAALSMAPLQIIIGAQTLHAVGYAMGIKHERADEVAVTYFGDGATSQGDVNEALIFASAFQLPVVFVCQNNHWAISEPVTVQSRFPLAGRAPGFGIPSLRFDGNDVLASLAAMRWALEHARTGQGPVFLEAVTYRMGPHTTADDPKRYRDADELELWRQRDPLTRVEAYLAAKNALTDEHRAAIQKEADDMARSMREACLSMVTREPLAVFDNVYSAPHPGLEAQRTAFADYLASFEEA
ncbi:pyruvate dehydrogenase (acetyl-transferring) E1 component subunit alpha [Microbacterium sp. YY-01]|uniref:pyruvate dehydrogenase (acetyl-transferring) E1 component subunit alpha n=1 Tax=Microbacterium sp. YY-01 TaxID=3421634 RepID=UPI003D1744C9